MGLHLLPTRGLVPRNFSYQPSTCTAAPWPSGNFATYSCTCNCRSIASGLPCRAGGCRPAEISAGLGRMDEALKAHRLIVSSRNVALMSSDLLEWHSGFDGWCLVGKCFRSVKVYKNLWQPGTGNHKLFIFTFYLHMISHLVLHLGLHTPFGLHLGLHLGLHSQQICIWVCIWVYIWVCIPKKFTFGFTFGFAFPTNLHLGLHSGLHSQQQCIWVWFPEKKWFWYHVLHFQTCLNQSFVRVVW